MSDNANPVGGTPEPTNSNPNPVGGPAQAKPSEPFKAYATAEDFEAHKAKILEAANKEAAKLRAELDGLRKKSETEAETKQREAVEAATAELRAKYESDKRASDLRLHLVAKGIEPAKADALIKLAPDQWEKPEEAAAAIEALVPAEFKPKTRTFDAGGGRQAETDSGYGFTQDEVNRAGEELPEAEFRAWRMRNREKIQKLSPLGHARRIGAKVN